MSRSPPLRRLWFCGYGLACALALITQQPSLLGFLADKRQPVALLPAGSGRYVLHNPQDGSESPITADVAATLESFAHVFYRSFGSGIIRGRELLRFTPEKRP